MASVDIAKLEKPLFPFTTFTPVSFHRQDKSATKDKNENHVPGLARDGEYYFVQNGMLGTSWSYMIRLSILHLLCLYGYYRFYLSSFDRTTNPRFYYTWLYCGLLHYIAIELGVSIGAHRLWGHRSWKARSPTRFILMIAETLCGQFTIYAWAWKHRVHHKWSDTNADPHTTMRGFFFVHMGWTLVQPHPEFYIKAKTLDFSDLMRDKIVKFQHDYYYLMFTLVTGITTIIPVYFWGENLFDSILFTFVIRYTQGLHTTWLVNSAAHMWGLRPYNAGIAAVQNLMVTFGISEGYHNYHHQYPFDYQSSEHGSGLNIGYHLINFLWAIGQAYDLKVVPEDVIKRDKQRAVEYLETHNAYHSC